VSLPDADEVDRRRLPARSGSDRPLGVNEESGRADREAGRVRPTRTPEAAGSSETYAEVGARVLQLFAGFKYYHSPKFFNEQMRKHCCQSLYNSMGENLEILHHAEKRKWQKRWLSIAQISLCSVRLDTTRAAIFFTGFKYSPNSTWIVSSAALCVSRRAFCACRAYRAMLVPTWWTS